MSEEEIIDIVKKEITNTYAEGKAMALQGLLDLYNKEKEKNKNSVSKDKIKEKIEYHKKIDNPVAIMILEKLLED